MTIQEIIRQITDNNTIKSVYFVGCGASRSDLHPAYYFLNNHSKVLRTSIHTANEFCYATPDGVDETAIVITCSLSGNTPESAKATTCAREKGAHVIALTHIAGSPLTKDAQYTVVFDWNDEKYSSKMDKMIKVLQMANEILNNVEGFAHYEKMNAGFEVAYDLIDKTVLMVEPAAKKFAEDYKDMPILYVTSSGALLEEAWSFSACLMMEMQWIASSSFHDGDFFHGPFELVEEGVPYLLLINEGRTRKMDLRALTFLQRFDAKLTVIDAKDFAIGNYFAKEVVDYFNPVILAPVMRIYAEQLAAVRCHPLSKRRYMWKLEY